MGKGVRPASGRHFRGTLLQLIALVGLVLQTRRDVLERSRVLLMKQQLVSKSTGPSAP